MQRVPVKTALLLLATLASVYLYTCATLIYAKDKPAGFKGYLLDTTGLDEKREPAWSETYESPGVSWRYLYQDGSVKILEHQRVSKETHGGNHAEFMKYEVQEPGVVVFGHYVDYPSVYNETSPSVWVRGDRPGVAIAALVVFPNTLRPDTNTPLTALLVGTSYQKPGEWERLGFAKGIDKTLDETVQAIRGEHKLQVDKNCAYIRQIVLLSEAKYGEYSLWIDDLEIKEHIRPTIELLRSSENSSAFNPINLLSCRLKLSQTPIFWQENSDAPNSYGTEPFAINDEKVAFKKNRKLNLSLDALSSLVSERNAVTIVGPQDKFSDRFNTLASNGDFRTQSDAGLPTFEESAFFLPMMEDDVLNPFETILAHNKQDRSISANIDPKGPVGQISFIDDKTEKSQTVNMLDPLDINPMTHPDYLELPSGGNLISGSGTLQSSDLATEFGFFHKGERLVSDAHIDHDVLGNLVANGKKIYSIRAIEYNGERFDFLKKLGFNAIWLRETLTPELLKEAQDSGMWLIAYPPSEHEEIITEEMLNAVGSSDAIIPQTNSVPNQKITTAYDPVLMWNIGTKLRAERANYVLSVINRLRAIDDRRRPTIASIYNGVQEYTEKGDKLDVVLLDRAPLLSSLDLNDYGEWLIDYQSFFNVRSVAFWNQIQTQPSENLLQQRLNFGLSDETPGLVTYEQMRQCVRLSMRAGCRGLLFTSSSPLDSKDRKTQYRAKALEAINLETQFLLTWFVMGRPEKNALKTSAQNLDALVFKVDRAALVAPISTDTNNQFMMGQDAVYNWEATIAVPESYTPDLLTPGALKKVLSRRKAGGCSFRIDEGSMNSLLFFSQSDALCQKTAENAAAFGRKMAELAIDLARKRIDMYEQTVYSIQYVQKSGASAANAPKAPLLGPVIDKALALLNEAETALKRRDVSYAYLAAERATREIRNAEKNFWKEATKTEISRPVTPLSTSFYDMPAYLELYEKLVSGKIRYDGNNLIQGGDMESPQTITQNGWQIYKEDSLQLTSVVTGNTISARSGKLGMHINVSALNDQPPVEAECPVVCVETQLPTQKGQLICIQGWIKIPQKLTNSVDGVQIYADQGGSALALRFKEQCNWKRFAFYRVASNENMRIRFAFSGCGDVYLDDIAAYVVK